MRYWVWGTVSVSLVVRNICFVAVHKVGSASLSRVIKGTVAKWGEAYTTQLSQGTSFSEPSLWWSLTISSVKRISKVSRISKKNTRHWNVTGSHRDPCNLSASLISHNLKPAARDGVERRGRRERRREERGEASWSNTETRLKFPLQLLVAHLVEMCVLVCMLWHTQSHISASVYQTDADLRR